jgi:hypothetical protein
MRVLVLHPEDVPWHGEWSAAHWDLIVDLGFAGANVYQDWGKRAGARVISLHQFAGQTESYRWVNQALEAGRGKFLDRMGLDWWEMLASWSYHELQALYLLERLRQELGSRPNELVATRAHWQVPLLSTVMGSPVRCIGKKPSYLRGLVSRISAAALNLRPSQIVEIAFDKWDPSYKLRRRVTKHRRVEQEEPVVLLPSAYSNVTRMQLAYAAQLPNRRFLLATTRHGGESRYLPSNVVSVPLAAYAEESGETRLETAELIEAWNVLSAELSKVEELRRGFQASVWDYFPRRLKSGLAARDAWHCLMSTAPVSGVLCGDDLNYYTRLPLILAKRMGRKAVYCYHGALDGGLLFKKSFADVHLVKGEMERSYALQVSDVERERIEIAAPEEAIHDSCQTGLNDTSAGDIVLFSQPYEVYGGRTGEIYREILLPLATVAQRLNRKIVLKLHPFESRRGRERLLRSVLPPEACARVEISSAPASEIFPRAICGIGLDSSVAVECAQREIPYFLCGWLDFNGFGYMHHFARFGAGTLLETPDGILSIPQRLREFKPDRSMIQGLWQPTADMRLDEIMFGSSRVLTSTKCAC